MTARDLEELRQEETAYERKCQIISEIAAYIDGMSNQAAYREQIDLLFAALETSVRDLESGGGLDDACAKEIVERVSELKREQEKYQVWLLGEAADWYGEETPRGEFVLVVRGAQPEEEGECTLEDGLTLAERLREEEGLCLRDAVRQAAKELGLSRNELYRLAVEQE